MWQLHDAKRQLLKAAQQLLDSLASSENNAFGASMWVKIKCSAGAAQGAAVPEAAVRDAGAAGGQHRPH